VPLSRHLPTQISLKADLHKSKLKIFDANKLLAYTTSLHATSFRQEAKSMYKERQAINTIYRVNI